MELTLAPEGQQGTLDRAGSIARCQGGLVQERIFLRVRTTELIKADLSKARAKYDLARENLAHSEDQVAVFNSKHMMAKRQLQSLEQDIDELVELVKRKRARIDEFKTRHDEASIEYGKVFKDMCDARCLVRALERPDGHVIACRGEWVSPM